jgi:hypothetical protein
MLDTIFTTPKGNDRLARLWVDLLADPVPPDPAAAQPRKVVARFEMDELQEPERRRPVLLSQDERAKRVSRGWRVNLATWLHRLVELEDAVSPSADEAGLSIPSPFRWEPKPGSISVPVRSGHPFSKATDARRSAPRPKIPIRPLHKQPFYSRFYFYLRRWLNRSVWHESDPAA